MEKAMGQNLAHGFGICKSLLYTETTSAWKDGVIDLSRLSHGGILRFLGERWNCTIQRISIVEGIEICLQDMSSIERNGFTVVRSLRHFSSSSILYEIICQPITLSTIELSEVRI